MKYGWLDPKRKAAKMAVALYFFPGGLGGSRLVRPAVIELEDGQLVEVSMFLADDETDVVQAVADLDELFEKNQRAQRMMPPERVRRKPGRKPKKKSK